ncbi:MAG: hypothetical protein NC418_05915 [Muribaculaceae bacterium]|nr:hypothetical protein [Muribaculaceae bacterium]
MIKHLLAATVVASAAFGAMAESHDTMYLIKGDHVVGKYNVDDVDYASFTLPEGISDDNIFLKLDHVGKNTVTYTVSTVNPTIAYAHNIISDADLDNMALYFEGTFFDELDDETKLTVMKYTLSTNGYIAFDTQSFTQRDYQDDGTGARFSVIPGTHYYLCAWELNPQDGSPLETFVYTEFETLAPAAGSAIFSATLHEVNEHGAYLDIEGSNVYYVSTCWGLASAMDSFVAEYGFDYLIGMFGQSWSLDFLQGTGDLGEGIPNSIWQIDGSGKYVLYTRAYDINGDITDNRFEFDIEDTSAPSEGPSFTIFSKSKDANSVSINFEITPSNVEEAYIRLMDENTVENRLNMGYELYELAMGGDAEDITNSINTTGEYTFTRTGIEEAWQSILIYAKDKDGNRSTLRLNFFPDTESEWSTYDPVYSAPARKIPAVKYIKDKRNPTIKKH